MLWIFLTAAAAPLQVARNALQRGLVGDAGPWGATLVRFLFGLPFALIIFAVVALATPEADPRFSWRFAKGDRVGVRPASQFLGPGDESVDLSGALYDLFLDADKQYSCAYFRTPEDTLEEAQALDVTKQGPVAPVAIETQLADELTMTLATVIGCGRLFWV